MATEVESWVRREIHSQGLEDNIDSYNFVVETAMAKLGLPKQTNKLRLLEKLSQHSTQKAGISQQRDKIRKITETLKDEAEDSKNRIRSIYKAREKKLTEQLSEAMRTIQRQNRALKTTPAKGQK